MADQIPTRLDQQTDAARARAAFEFAEKFRRFVDNLVTPDEASEAFAVYRRFDLAQTRGGQSSSIDSMKEAAPKLCDDLAVHFQSIPKAVITKFVEESWTDYATKRSLLFAARSRGTHVSGVLRPLSRRYLKQWESEIIKHFDYHQIQVRADALLEEHVNTKQEFEKWTERVFALFYEVGVYRKPETGGTIGNFDSKPSGMISEGSVRTYKQQWFSWTAQNAETLLSVDSSAETSLEDSANPLIEDSSIEEMAVQRSSGARLALYSSDDPSFRIEKTWPRISDLLMDLDDWCETANKVWSDKQSFVVLVDLLENKSNLQASFEEDSLSAVASRVRAILSTAK